VRRLAVLVDAAAQRVRNSGRDHWATWLEKDTHFIRQNDLYGVEHLLRAYGGMGSLNDEVSSDLYLRRLLELIYRLARDLWREEDAGVDRKVAVVQRSPERYFLSSGPISGYLAWKSRITWRASSDVIRPRLTAKVDTAPAMANHSRSTSSVR
jgi:hypothetical protein